MDSSVSNSDLLTSKDDLGALFDQHQARLKRMIALRLDRRLNNRVDASDVLQDAFVEASRRFEEYKEKREVSPFVWMRFLTVQKVAELHRYHFGVKARDVRREFNVYDHVDACSGDLAAQLVGNLTTPSTAARRAEQRELVQEMLEQMDPIDREVLALRHFEQLGNAEAAEVLGIEKQAAYRRHVRAVRRLYELLHRRESDKVADE